MTSSTNRHIPFPDDVWQEIDNLCKNIGLRKKSVLDQVFRAGWQHVLQRYGNVPGAASPSPSPRRARPASKPPAPVEAAPAAEFDVTVVRHEGATWLDLVQVCQALRIEPESVLDEIDPDDDVIHYLGADWITQRGVSEAITLCCDYDLADRFKAWSDKVFHQSQFPTTAQ